MEIMKNVINGQCVNSLECTSHHHACDCREEKMLLICRQLMKEHNELKKFTAGFGKVEMCDCPACMAAIELYGQGAKCFITSAFAGPETAPASDA